MRTIYSIIMVLVPVQVLVCCSMNMTCIHVRREMSLVGAWVLGLRGDQTEVFLVGKMKQISSHLPKGTNHDNIQSMVLGLARWCCRGF